MPIAFDPPAGAPHGTLPARPARAPGEDAGTLDLFTQFLLAASGARDAAPADPRAPERKDTVAGDAPAADVPVLMLPLPSTASSGTPPEQAVASATTDKLRAARPLAAATGKPGGVQPAAAAATSAQPASLAGAVDNLPPGLKDLAARPEVAPAAVAQPAPAADPSPAAPDPRQDAARLRADTPTPPPAVSALAAVTAAAIADKGPNAKPRADLSAAPGSAITPVHVSPSPAAPPVHVATVAAPAFTPGWQDETVAKLAHIVLTRNERAELKLNPAELGPLSIRVEMNADHASVTIVAASAETRSALEQSLPQLRDLLSSQGITLGQASVHDGTAQRDSGAPQWTVADAGDARGAAPAADTVHLVARHPDRLVDVFA